MHGRTRPRCIGRALAATELDLPAAVTVGVDGTVYVGENASIPLGTASIRPVS